MKTILTTLFLLISISVYSQCNFKPIQQSIISTGIAYDNEIISTVFIGGRLNNFEMGLNYYGNFNNYNSLGGTFNYYIPLSYRFELLFGTTINNIAYNEYTRVNYVVSANIGLGYKLNETWKIQISTTPIRSITPILSSFGVYYSL